MWTRARWHQPAGKSPAAGHQREAGCSGLQGTCNASGSKPSAAAAGAGQWCQLLELRTRCRRRVQLCGSRLNTYLRCCRCSLWERPCRVWSSPYAQASVGTPRLKPARHLCCAGLTWLFQWHLPSVVRRLSRTTSGMSMRYSLNFSHFLRC